MTQETTFLKKRLEKTGLQEILYWLTLAVRVSVILFDILLLKKGQ